MLWLTVTDLIRRGRHMRWKCRVRSEDPHAWSEEAESFLAYASGKKVR